MICNYMAAGAGMTEAAAAVNAYRESIPDLEPVSWSAVRSFVKKSGLMRVHKRRQCKSGKRDIETLWSTLGVTVILTLRLSTSPASSSTASHFGTSFISSVNLGLRRSGSASCAVTLKQKKCARRKKGACGKRKSRTPQ